MASKRQKHSMMNLPLQFPSFLLLLYLVTCSLCQAAEDPVDNAEGSSKQPSSAPTTVSVSSSFTQNPNPVPALRVPSAAPSAAMDRARQDIDDDSDDGACTNDPNWLFEYEYMVFWAKETEELGCDNDRVECCWNGNLGFARDHCCKCNYMTEDCAVIPEDTKSFYSQVLTGLAFVFGILVSLKLIRQMELRLTRHTMMARRQQQRENNHQGLTEEERNNARYEIFASAFHFQEVALLPDKSNTTADGVRRSSLKLDVESSNGEESKTEMDDNADGLPVPEISRYISENPLRLAGWRKPAAKDECCICLECYTPGETICAPITPKCDHAFHEGCIYEWFKRGNDKCPLCRVEFLKD